MKLLFTADLHLKIGAKNVPPSWTKSRFQMFLRQFGEMQKEADLVILGGDVFDKVPSVDEIEMYFDLVASLKKPTIIFDGNHEASKKGATFLSFLKKATNQLNPLVRIVDDYEYLVAYDLDIIPYCRLRDFEKNHKTLAFNGKICCSHFRAEIPPHVKPELDLSLFDRWQVVLAGDLHSYENSQRNILYPGSPYTTSFHRTTVDTGAILLDTDTLLHFWLKFDLPQLLKKTITADETPEASSFHHTMYEVEGSLQDLSALANHELIDKKVVKRSQDAHLILDPKMTLVEEVNEYLTYILELPQETIQETLNELLNHADKLQF